MTKNFTFFSLSAALLSVSSIAFSHTTIKDQLTEGSSGYTALQIGHGCGDAKGVYHHVTGQSVVFPTGNAAATKTENGAEVPVGSLADYLTAGAIDGAVSLVADRNLFTKQAYKVNQDGKVIGFTLSGGDLYTSADGVAKMRGLVPFHVGAQSFVPTSCAKTVKIKMAVADICDALPLGTEGSVNTWIPSAAQLGVSAYPIADLNFDGVGSAATLTIKRDLTKNPLPSSCGEGEDINIWPSVEDIEKYLPQL